MANFWNKLKELFQPQDAEVDDGDIDFSIPKPVPLDERFADYFTQAGGHFLYCENERLALSYLRQIIQTENISRFICFDEQLQTFLNTINANHINYPSATADFCFLTCESLIAYNGSIVLSSDVTAGRKLSELPENFIIFAKYDQIVNHLSEAMQILNRNKVDRLPSGITSIGGVDANPMENEPSNKIIYLLLLD